MANLPFRDEVVLPSNQPTVQFLEDFNQLNVTAAQAAPGFKCVRVPSWATKAVFTIFYDASGGTTPLFDFVLGVPDWGSPTLLNAPTDATDVATFGNAAWDGITQVTGAGPYQIVVEVGPDVTDDDTGSATASCYYGVKGELPPIIAYKYTLDRGTTDEDYTFRIAVLWR